MSFRVPETLGGIISCRAFSLEALSNQRFLFTTAERKFLDD